MIPRLLQKVSTVSEVEHTKLTMGMSEIDSFVLKFKQLLHSGKKAHLDIKSVTGKATIHLTVEVDVSNQHPRVQPRNGPARERRREKRAAAREEAAGVAAVNEEEVGKVSGEESEKETNNVVVSTVKVAETANKVEAK